MFNMISLVVVATGKTKYACETIVDKLRISKSDYFEAYVRKVRGQYVVPLADFVDFIWWRLCPNEPASIPGLIRASFQVHGRGTLVGAQVAVDAAQTIQFKRRRMNVADAADAQAAEEEVTRSIRTGQWYEEAIADAQPDTPAGYVYAITSPLVAVVKIGYWKGGLPELRSRYVTYYGPQLELYCKMFEDCAAAEKAMHAAFTGSAVTHELFDKAIIDKYKNYLS
jgi:hypothetical protein